ncbi:ankyrin repeat domain-containing protein, partial [Bacteroidota bacterium]
MAYKVTPEEIKIWKEKKKKSKLKKAILKGDIEYQEMAQLALEEIEKNEIYAEILNLSNKKKDPTDIRIVNMEEAISYYCKANVKTEFTERATLIFDGIRSGERFVGDMIDTINTIIDLMKSGVPNMSDNFLDYHELIDILDKSNEGSLNNIEKKLKEEIESNSITMEVLEEILSIYKKQKKITNEHIDQIESLLLNDNLSIDDIIVDDLEEEVQDLHFAIEKNDKEMVIELIESGADVNKKNDYGKTALMSSIIECQFNNQTEIIKLLLENGAKTNKQNNDGNTALHFAASFGSSDIVTLLIKHGANINITNKNGEKAIDVANRNNNYPIVKVLESSMATDKFININRFKVPEGVYTKYLAEEDETHLEEAITKISSLAQQGNREGLDELESLIKANCSDPQKCTFYKTQGMRMSSGDNSEYINKLVDFAASDGLLEHISESQSCMTPLMLSPDGLETAINSIREASNKKEVRVFQLLYAQFTINA